MQGFKVLTLGRWATCARRPCAAIVMSHDRHAPCGGNLQTASSSSESCCEARRLCGGRERVDAGRGPLSPERASAAASSVVTAGVSGHPHHSWRRRRCCLGAPAPARAAYSRCKANRRTDNARWPGVSWLPKRPPHGRLRPQRASVARGWWARRRRSQALPSPPHPPPLAPPSPPPPLLPPSPLDPALAPTWSRPLARPLPLSPPTSDWRTPPLRFPRSSPTGSCRQPFLTSSAWGAAAKSQSCRPRTIAARSRLDSRAATAKITPFLWLQSTPGSSGGDS